MSDDLEETIMFLIRAGIVSAHFLELAGISAATTVILLWVAEESYEMYVSRKHVIRLVHNAKHKGERHD